MILPGWICACRCFNGEAKELVTRCRACGDPKPDTCSRCGASYSPPGSECLFCHRVKPAPVPRLATCEWCGKLADVRYVADDEKWRARFSCTEPACCASMHRQARLEGIANGVTGTLNERGFVCDGRKVSTETEQIHAAHPLRSGRHDLYAEAMRLVGERHAKADLVDLVCWLLLRAQVAEVPPGVEQSIA